jgi:hypothetical protein
MRISALRVLMALVAAALFRVPAIASDKYAIDVVASAIEAHGGAANLTQMLSYRRIAKGVIQKQDGNAHFESEVSFQAPDSCRERFVSVENGRTTTIAFGFHKGVAWRTVNGKTSKVTEAEIKYAEERCHIMRLLALTPLLDEKNVNLEYLGEKTVDDAKYYSVRVRAAGRKDIELLFDVQTRLLCRLIYERFVNDKIDSVTTLYTNHRNQNGLIIPAGLRRTNSLSQTTIEEVTSFQPILNWPERYFEGDGK